MCARVGRWRGSRRHGRLRLQRGVACLAHLPCRRKSPLIRFQLLVQSGRDVRVRLAGARLGARIKRHRVPGSSGVAPVLAIRACLQVLERCRCSSAPGERAPSRVASGRGGGVPSHGVWLRKRRRASDRRFSPIQPLIYLGKAVLPKFPAGPRRGSYWLQHRCRIRGD